MTATITIDPGGADETVLDAGKIDEFEAVKIHTGVSNWRAFTAYDTSLADLRGSAVHIEDSATSYFFRGFLIRVADHERQGEAVTQLKGLGSEHDLQRNENEKTITNQYVHDAISDYWTAETSFTATVTDQTADDTVTDEQAQEADTNAEWNAIASAIEDTDPLAVQNTNTELLQTCFTTEAEDSTDSGGSGSTFIGDIDALSGGDGWQLSDAGDFVEYQFTLNYDIPVGDPDQNEWFQVWTRNAGTGTDLGEVVVKLDGTALDTNWTTSTNGTFAWAQQLVSAPATAIASGQHTLRFELLSGGADNHQLDVIAPNDGRFNYTFDNTLDANQGALDGPQLYPDEVELELDRAATTWSINQATLTTTWDDTTNNQRIQLRLPPDGTWGGSGDNTDTITDFGFGTDQGTAVQGRARFSRYGSQATTPKTGINGQKLQSWEITFDGDDIPVYTDVTLEGSDMEILQQAHADANMRFTVEHADGTKNVESYPIGAIVKDKPDWRVISTERVHDLGGDYANHITVRGARDDDGNRIKRTVSNATEIANFDQEHWEEKRPGATTQTQVERIARQVLKRHLQASDVTAEREIFSLDIEPGYSYPITQPDGTETNVPSEEVHYRVSAGDVKGRILFNVRATQLQERLNAVDAGLRSTKLAF